MLKKWHFFVFPISKQEDNPFFKIGENEGVLSHQVTHTKHNWYERNDTDWMSMGQLIKIRYNLNELPDTTKSYRSTKWNKFFRNICPRSKHVSRIKKGELNKRWKVKSLNIYLGTGDKQ